MKPWHALSAPIALSLGCAGAQPVVMTCSAAPRDGTALVASLSLENTSAETVTVLGMSVPWLYRHAVHFEAEGFLDPHVVVDPGEYETLILLPGDTAGGEIALADRALDSFGRSLEEVPGTYEVQASARLTLDPETPRQRRIDARCSFAVVVAPRE